MNHAACLLNLYLFSPYLERHSDRGTNIVEEVIHLVESEIIRGKMN